jgi:hypothetical protein
MALANEVGRQPQTRESQARQPWIHSAAFDLLLIFAPPFLACAAVFYLHAFFPHHFGVGPLSWLALVVCVDVAHVYSSLFRTYADPFLEARALLWIVPLGCWLVGALLYSLAPGIFWKALAYVAVFHFIRQQYGFVMIYARAEKNLPTIFRHVDRVTIYAATLYPLLFWHTHLPRNFNWFVDGDFFGGASPALDTIAGGLYLFILAVYGVKELWLILKLRHLNLPRNLMILATGISWYVGIVWLNDDLAFTLTNVVSHGIPYVALIWLYGRKKTDGARRGVRLGAIFRRRFIPLYLGLLVLLAYLEEGLWDGFIWRDHGTLFPGFSELPVLHDPWLLAMLVPLLALPQSTHYIFDAFLWRASGPNSGWKDILMKPKRGA